MTHKNAFLLTGPPGCGKTTVIEKVLERVGRKAGGFFTREIRQGGVRKGFKIVTLDGEEALLSHIDFRFPEKVGKYGVDVDTVDRVAVPAMEKAIEEADIIVIDEIGKMELFSHGFKNAVFDALGSEKIVLGTILYTKHLWADEIKHLPGVEVIMVTPKNRKGIVDMLVEMIQELV